MSVTPQWILQILKLLKSEARSNKVIIKKDVPSVILRKKKLKSADITNEGLPWWSLVFINQSVCPYY